MIKPSVEEMLSNPWEQCAGNTTQVEKTNHSHTNTIESVEEMPLHNPRSWFIMG